MSIVGPVEAFDGMCAAFENTCGMLSRVEAGEFDDPEAIQREFSYEMERAIVFFLILRDRGALKKARAALIACGGGCLMTLIVKEALGGFVILDRNTNRIVRDHIYPTRAHAQRAADFAEVSPRLRKSKKRPCITCGTAFDSEGAHNRMCDRCRTKPDTEYGFATGRRVIHV